VSVEQRLKLRRIKYMQFRNRRRTEPKLRSLLKRYRFAAVRDVYPDAVPTSEAP